MSSGTTAIAQEVIDDSQLNEDQTPAGKELKKEIKDVYTTPVAEHYPLGIENLSATSKLINASNDTDLSSKALPTQVEDIPVPNTSQKAPLVPPRHRKRRVTELKCSEVRWFHRKSGTETKWTPFKG